MTPEELAEVEERMNRVYTEEIRQDGLALVAEVRRLREELDHAKSEFARLGSALEAATRIIRRKADREAGREET